MRLFICLFVLMALMPLRAEAQQDGRFLVSLDMLADRDVAVAGETITLGIRQNIEPDWHTYWLNAGDSGEGLTVSWQDLPQGVTIGPMQYPAPEKIFYDPLMNYGYHGSPIYLFDVTLPDVIDTDVLTFKAETMWLVCNEICIPEEATISLTMRVGAQSRPVHAALFNAARNSIPEKVKWDATLSQNADTSTLTVTIPHDADIDFSQIDLFPYEWGIIANAAKAATSFDPDTRILTVSQAIGDRNKAAVTALNTTDFVIKTPQKSFQVTAKTNVLAVSAEPTPQNLMIILAFALLGGLILNLMPCVFPVLSMKALSLVKLSDKERRHAQSSGLAYTFGIILSFIAIAAMLIGLKSAGESIGWGFQLQNPMIITALALLLFVIGLNLSGWFDIKSRFVNLGGRLTQGNNLKASFFTGVLATLVATPCSAPFMASAIGFAMTQNAVVALIVFAVLGFGLALPYLVLCFIPATQKLLPKPGAWMDTFRQFLAFPMFASAIWLVWVLGHQTGSAGILYALSAMLAVTFIIWLGKKGASKIVTVILAVLVIGSFIIALPMIQPVDTSTPQSAQVFSQSKLDDILRNNPQQPVFVNMTASWCITCLVNERVALSTDDTKALFKAHDVIYMKGDWTNRNQEITQFLEQFDRNGVPLYVYYGPAGADGQRPKARILPQILTPSIVKSAIEDNRN